MKHKILVPIDFGSQSVVALDYARFFALKIDAKLLLLNVLEESGILQKFLTPDLEEKMANQAKLALKGLAEEHLRGMDYEYCVRVGKPYEIIEAAAEDHKPIMIVMGKTEELSLKQKFLGSNTLNVIQETKYPVVSVRGKQAASDLTDYILLPMDLSRPVREQVNAAIEFARLLKARVFALSVDVKDDVAYETHLLTEMHKIKKAIEQAGVECETKIIEGRKSDVVEIISDHANKLKPMLTVIMVRDESKFDQWMMGSVARDIIRTLDYPVMSIRPWNPRVEQNPIIKLIVDPMNVL